MKRWVLSPETSEYLSLLGFVAALALCALCFGVYFGALQVPTLTPFLIVPLVFVFFLPATSLVALRAESMGRFRLSPELWRVFFGGTPLLLALLAIAYFYAMGGWVLFSDLTDQVKSGSSEAPDLRTVFFSGIASPITFLVSTILFGNRPGATTDGAS